MKIQDITEGYGRYYCSTDKKWKERQGPKQTREGVAEEKQRLDAKCWKGYKKQGTKMKGDTRVNNCVPESIDADQKKARQVPATEMPKKTSPVLGKAPKQHPFKGRAVGGGL
jgi:hypothetical protein